MAIELIVNEPTIELNAGVQQTGGGAVNSVNGKTGDVVLSYEDVEAASAEHTHKKEDIINFPSIPSKTSDLTNDSGFLTSHQDISGKQDVITDLETIRSGAALGATAIQEHQDISGKVDKVEGKELSTNDFDNRYKDTLDNLSSNYYNKAQTERYIESAISNYETIRDFHTQVSTTSEFEEIVEDGISRFFITWIGNTTSYTYHESEVIIKTITFRNGEIYEVIVKGAGMYTTYRFKLLSNGLPEVSSTDNGSVIRVDNGKWVKQTISSAVTPDSNKLITSGAVFNAINTAVGYIETELGGI